MDEEVDGRHERGRLTYGKGYHLSQPANQFLPSLRSNLIGGALGAAAVAADARRGDQARREETADGVIKRPALEDQNLVPMALEEQALHFVRVHGALAEETENGEIPEPMMLIWFILHIVHMKYIM